MSAAPALAWDSTADGWDQHAEMLEGWLQDSTTAMLDAADIKPGSKVLDVAAGSGSQTLAIARRIGPAGSVLATDISPRFLQLAHARLKDAGFDGLQTRVADAQALGLDGAGFDATFDAVVCRLGLMFCAAPVQALTGIAHALKPGGRFSALVFAAPARNPCISIIMATALRHAGRAQPTSPMPGSLLSLGRPGLLAELMAAAGLIDIEVRAIAAPMRLPSCQSYIDFVRTAGLPVMAILAPLSAGAQHAAWRDIEQQLQSYSRSDD